MITLRCSKMSTHATSTSIPRFQKCVNPLFFDAEKLQNDPFFLPKGAKLTVKRKNAALNGGTAHALELLGPLPRPRARAAAPGSSDAATSSAGHPLPQRSSPAGALRSDGRTSSAPARAAPPGRPQERPE